MKLPEQLEAKFQSLLTRYPIKRSALIPMLLYGQDVFGFVSDELVAEIAARLGSEHAASHRDDGVLLHAAAQAGREISRASVHECLLHAAWRK